MPGIILGRSGVVKVGPLGNAIPKRANTSFTYLGSYADSRMACQLVSWLLSHGFENMTSFSGNA
jgi:hypothetical protein